MPIPIVIALQPLPLVDGSIEAVADDEIAVRTVAGYVSVQPNGTVEAREAIGLWERATRIGANLVRYDGAGYVQYFFVQETTVPPPVPPAPPVPSPQPLIWDVAVDLNLEAPAAREAFITFWTTRAYGVIGDVPYWMDKADEMLERGAELEMVPPARYFLEKLIGRGSGGASIAKYGPYAGRSEDQQSRTPWPA